VCAWSHHQQTTAQHGQVLELLLDRKALEARHSRELAARDASVAQLQVYIDEQLSELQQRQAQVCVGAALLGKQQRDGRARA
jgi:hypothetical protein